jgi:lanthanide-dependent methanol dehydrogenase
MAPLVVKHQVLVGDGGGEMGTRGELSGLDADTGKIAWQAFTCGPDSEVLIGPNFKLFYPSERGKIARSTPGSRALAFSQRVNSSRISLEGWSSAWDRR